MIALHTSASHAWPRSGLKGKLFPQRPPPLKCPRPQTTIKAGRAFGFLSKSKRPPAFNRPAKAHWETPPDSAVTTHTETLLTHY